MTAKTRVFTSIAILCLYGSPDVGVAQSECEQNDDCEQGFECRVVGSSGCAVPDCAPGEDCPDMPPCEDQELSLCVLAACESDADCAEGMLCHEYESRDCPDSPSCAPGVDCGASDAEEECELETQSQCLPRWALPCQVDADCGDGFLCEELENCQCSGGGSDGEEPTALDAGSAVGPDVSLQQTEPDCSCTPSGKFACRSEVTECATDTDCPADWICTASGTSCGGGSSADGGASEPREACEPGSQRTCTPPNYYRYSDVTGYGDGASNPLEPGDDDGETGGEAPDAGEPPTGTEPDAGIDDGTNLDPADSSSSTVNCNCRLVPDATRAGRNGLSGLGLLVVLGLGLVRRRKRSLSSSSHVSSRNATRHSRGIVFVLGLAALVLFATSRLEAQPAETSPADPSAMPAPAAPDAPPASTMPEPAAPSAPPAAIAPPPASATPPPAPASVPPEPAEDVECKPCGDPEKEPDEGAGMFLLGAGVFDFSSLNDRLTANGYDEVETVLTLIGGEGHAVFASGFIAGARGGAFLAPDGTGPGDVRTQFMGGFGMLDLGFAMVRTRSVLFSLTGGVGGYGFSLDIHESDSPTFDEVLENPARGSSLGQGGLLAGLGLGLDGRVPIGPVEDGRRGFFTLGARVGGFYGPALGSWGSAQGDAAGGPNTGLASAYAMLAIGFGGGKVDE